MDQRFRDLFGMLCLYHNMDGKMTMQDAKWLGYCAELNDDIEHIPDLIGRIKSGELATLLKGRSVPNLSDIKALMTSVKRVKNMQAAPNALPAPEVQRNNKNRLAMELQNNFKAPDDFDLSDPKKWSRWKWDAYLDRKHPRRR